MRGSPGDGLARTGTAIAALTHTTGPERRIRVRTQRGPIQGRRAGLQRTGCAVQ